MRLLVTIIFLIFIINNAFGQAYQFFYTRFGAEQDDVAKSIIQAVDSGYFVIGHTTSFGAKQNDVYVSKTDKNLVPVWQKNFGGIGNDIGLSVVQLNDSGIVIVGYSNSFGAGGYDAYILRLSKLGTMIWQKTFGGISWDFANSVKKSNDGGLIVCGSTFSFGNGSRDAFIFKMDLNGNLIWNKTYGGTKDDEFKEIISTSDGNYICVGSSMSYGDTLADVWAAKVNNNGDSLWYYLRGGNKKDVGNSIVEDANGDFLIAGGSESFTSGMEDIYLFKLSKTRNLIWDRFYGMPNKNEEAFSIKNSTSKAGNMILCYTTNEISTFKLDAKALLLDGLGFYVDGGRVGSFEDDEVFSITNCYDKGYALAGYTRSFNADLKDVFIIKFDSLVHGTGTLILSNSQITKDNFETIRYNNPFNENLKLLCSSVNGPPKIELYDAMGNLIIETKQLEAESFEILTSAYKTGIYTLRITLKNQIKIVKLICIH